MAGNDLFNIPVRITYHPRERSRRCYSNSRNLVKIVPTSSHQQSRNKRRNCLPNVLLFNARSICSKISEVEIAISMHKSDIVFVTETWLNHNIPDELAQIAEK